MSIDLEKTFLTINNDYPPDASRGFDVRQLTHTHRRHQRVRRTVSDSLLSHLVCAVQLPSAVLTLLPNASASTAADSSFAEPAIRFYTTGLLVLLPFPDMSMPFNVVAFTSTVLAFFFGSLFNLTYSTTANIVKRSQQTPLSRVRGRLAALRGRCRRPVRAVGGGERDGVTGVELVSAKVGEEEKKEAAEEEVVEEATEDGPGPDTLTAAISTTRLRKVPLNSDARPL